MKSHCSICVWGASEVVRIGNIFNDTLIEDKLSILHTSLTGHEIFCLVFAEVETAGQNHIIIVSL